MKITNFVNILEDKYPRQQFLTDKDLIILGVFKSKSSLRLADNWGYGPRKVIIDAKIYYRKQEIIDYFASSCMFIQENFRNHEDML